MFKPKKSCKTFYIATCSWSSTKSIFAHFVNHTSVLSLKNIFFSVMKGHERKHFLELVMKLRIDHCVKRSYLKSCFSSFSCFFPQIKKNFS